MKCLGTEAGGRAREGDEHEAREGDEAAAAAAAAIGPSDMWSCRRGACVVEREAGQDRKDEHERVVVGYRGGQGRGLVVKTVCTDEE